jgi:uncharacterized protein YbjT (DUF2867 family)
MKIAVTGATGYIGGHFVKCARASGHRIVALSRRSPALLCSDWVPYDLSWTVEPVIPAGTEVVVHLATSQPSNPQQEISAAERLIAAAKKVGARIVFVSSQTARPDAPTAYGRTKWHIEQQILSAGGWIVRPGQVYGGELRGLFGTLVETVKRLPVLPAFIPAPKVQPIHADDLSEGMLRLAERSDLQSGVYCLAMPTPVPFSVFLAEIARSRLRCRRVLIPVPVVIIKAFTVAVGKSWQNRLGLERLFSLFDLPVMPSASDLERLGLALRPLRSGMHLSGNDRRRRLLLEGSALLAYVLTDKADGVLLRRYVRAIEKLRSGRPLALPGLLLQWPALLALVDGSDTGTVWRQEFRWRLDAATSLAEATTQGAQHFLGLGYRHGFATSLFGMTRAIVAEVNWRILGLLLAPMIRNMLPQSWDELP